MTRVEPHAAIPLMRTLAISVEANVRAANVKPELEQAAHAGSERMTAEGPRSVPRKIMIMAGGTGGHIFGFGRARRRSTVARLTRARRGLACTQSVATSAGRSGVGRG